jgi:hypothetical protein
MRKTKDSEVHGQLWGPARLTGVTEHIVARSITLLLYEVPRVTVGK